MIRRLRQYAPQFSELEASRFTVAALFGADSAAPFAAVVSAHNQVFHAAEALLKYRDQLDEPNLEDFLRAMRRRAFGLEALDAQGNPLPDEVKATLDGAIASIERVCRHALESEIAAEAGRPIAA